MLYFNELNGLKLTLLIGQQQQQKHFNIAKPSSGILVSHFPKIKFEGKKIV